MDGMRTSGFQYSGAQTLSPSFSGVMSRGPGLSSNELGGSSVYTGASPTRYTTGAAPTGVAADLAHMELREEAINKTSILLLEDNKRQIGNLRSEIQGKESLIRQLEDQNRVLKDTSSYHAAEKEKIIADFRAANQKLASTETELKVKEIMLDRAQKDSSKQRELLEGSIREEQDKNVALQKSLIQKDQLLTQVSADLNNKTQQLSLSENARNSLQADISTKERLISALTSQISSKDAQIAGLTKDKQIIPELQFENNKLKEDLNKYRTYEEMYRAENTKRLDLESTVRAKELSGKQDAERIAALNSLIASYKDRSEKQEQTINQLRYSNEQLESELSKARNINTALETELATAKVNIGNMEARIKDMDDYIKDLDVQIDKMKHDNEALNNDNILKDTELDNKNRMFQDMAKNLGCSPSQISTIPSRVEELLTTVDGLKLQLSHTQMDAAAKNSELLQLKDESSRKIDELSKSLGAANVDKEILNSRVNQLNDEITNNYVPKVELEKAKAELASEQSRSQVLSSGIDRMRNDLENSKKTEDSLKRTVTQLQTERDLGDSKIQALQKRVDNLELHNTILTKDANEKSSKVQQLENETSSLRNSLSNMRTENSYLNSQNSQLSTRLNEASQRSNYLDSQVKSLESSLQAKEMEKLLLEQEQKAKAEKRFSLLEQRVRGEEEINSAIAEIAPASSLATSRSSVFSPRISQSVVDEPTGMVSPGRVLQQSRTMSETELASIIGELDRNMRGM